MSGLSFVEAVKFVSSVGFVADGGEATAKDRKKKATMFSILIMFWDASRKHVVSKSNFI